MSVLEYGAPFWFYKVWDCAVAKLQVMQSVGVSDEVAPHGLYQSSPQEGRCPSLPTVPGKSHDTRLSHGHGSSNTQACLKVVQVNARE